MSEIKERAVQTYLAFLENPGAVNRELLADLENQFSVAGNPIIKLRVLAEMDRIRAGERMALEDDFVRHASAWAAENAIPPTAFLALGVNEEVLTKAGFTIEPNALSGQGAAKKPSSKSSKQASKRSASFDRSVGKPRAKSVNGETVEKLILAATEPFSVRDIVAVSHATNATVSRVVGWLVAAKRVEKIGLLPPQGSRGIAPTGYRVKQRKPAA